MLDKKYLPKEIEAKWQKYWEKNHIYKFNPNQTKKIYAIDTPPPTVSGKMHMGHAFGNSQQDFIARYKRMQGFNVLQPFGTDDNGLPTQILVQKIKKVFAYDMNPKEFRKLCLDTIEKELKPEYTQDWKKLGISCDFTVNYSTIDKHCQKISQKSFIELYEKGMEYRKEAPAMFCPKCRTAISQMECEDKEFPTFFNDIIFKTENKELVIATTRPELLPACVAIFYHPDDKRYKKLKGKMAEVPLFDFQVPILEDKRADPEKGTGLVMCCTFGDQTDMEWQKAHNLPIKEAISLDGKMSSLAGKYENMKPGEARKKIIQELKEKSLIKNQKQIKHQVNVHERCGTPIEFIHSKQWFIKYLDLKKDMLKWGNQLNWFPTHMKNRYDNWVKGLAWDWCISRQIPFGIPFPVWYCEECDEIILAKIKDLPIDPTIDKPPVDKCPNCSSKKIIPETDIINTWATSSLTPTIVKELFKGKKCYNYLTKHPMDLRPQGHDIITFWLFNTVIKSQLHFNMLPWNDCFINGWMLDPKGKKMAKSKGNIIEPQGMIEKYSADALRFMSAGCKLGDDFPFQEKDLISGSKFANKFWNASKFVFMHIEKYKKTTPSKLGVMDKWLLSKLNTLIKSNTSAFEKHDFMRCKMDTEKFFLQSFCDNYLEIVKHKLYNLKPTDKEKIAIQYSLYNTLLTILKTMAPIMPHITEEIYNSYFIKQEKTKSIHLTEWPKSNKKLINAKIEEIGNTAIEIISAVRKYKSTNQMSLKEELSELIIQTNKKELKKTFENLKETLNIKSIKFGKASTICGNLKITIKK